jgi:hypothetical protein
MDTQAKRKVSTTVRNLTFVTYPLDLDTVLINLSRQKYFDKYCKQVSIYKKNLCECNCLCPKRLQYIVTVTRRVIGTAVLCGTGFHSARVM